MVRPIAHVHPSGAAGGRDGPGLPRNRRGSSLARPETCGALADALRQPALPLPPTPIAALARSQSQVIERLLRQQRTPLQILVYTSSAIRRAGLAAILRPDAQVVEAETLPALLALLDRRRRWTALLADAGALGAVLPIAQDYGIPLVLIAAEPRRSHGFRPQCRR